MLSESKKQNPKPAAGEHRVISRLKAAEEASKKIQADSESVVPEVAGVCFSASTYSRDCV